MKANYAFNAPFREFGHTSAWVSTLLVSAQGRGKPRKSDGQMWTPTLFKYICECRIWVDEAKIFITSMMLRYLKELIDGKGELRIPESINLCDFEGPSLQYQLVNVGPNAFDGLTELKKLFVPASCLSIEWCFYHCHNLSEINVDENNLKYCSIDGVLFSKDKTVMVAYPNAHGREYNVPDGVEKIGKNAFKSCRDIEVIRLSESVHEIEKNALYECCNLKKVFLPDNFKKFHEHSGNAKVTFTFEYRGHDYSYEEILKQFGN